ncbi:MAG TPA: T9SS type A sorting domain-containing protein, partial [Candidatus Kapabacteria bacterium]
VFSPSQLAGDTVDLGSFAPGSTDNNFMYTIRNRSPRMVTITDARESGDVNKSFTAPLGSLVNKVFMPGDTAYYFVTYNAPSRKEVSSEVLFTITYTTDRGETGFIYYKYTARTRPCYSQKPSGSLVMEPAIPGGYTKASFIFRNNDPNSVTLTSITMGSGLHAEYFTLDTPFAPLWVGPFGDVEMTYRFRPADTVVGMAYVPLRFTFDIPGIDTICKTMNYELRSSTISPFDTSVIPLYPNQTASLPMASEKDTATKRFRFQNNLSIPVTVVSVDVSDTGHFTITSTDPSALPAVIEPNGMFTVDVLFHASDTGYYSDDLVIVTDHAISSETFHLKALRMSQLPVAVDEPEVVTQYLHITPNPAVSGVLCSVPVGTKKISIYDALGNLIAQKENTSEWNWAAVHSDGTPVASGVYFVRAEGVSGSRRPFVISKKLIIER